MDIQDIYKAKKAAESEICDILKGFTLATGMPVDGVKVIQIDTAKEAINVYYKTRLDVKL